MIDLSQYEIGQRFRTRSGVAVELREVLCTRTPYPYVFRRLSGERYYSSASKFGCFLSLREPSAYDIVRPIYSIPANTRRIPSIQLDPILEKAV